MSRTSNFLSKFIKLIWFAFFAGLLLLAALFIMISKTQIPDTEELENPNYEYATVIYSEEIEEIGRYYEYNRDWVTYENLNPNLVNALIATEDERFLKHSGIDAKGTMRALIFMGKRGGASTITQQLAKLFFTQRSSSFIKRVWQKMKEWIIAIEFEKRYTKEEILAMYLNKFDFINGAHGVAAASQTYFGKKQKDLNIQESALIIGMLQNPSQYNPRRFPEQAAHRRNVVLYQMVKNGYLDKVDFEKFKEEEYDVSKFKRDVHFEGFAPYFRSTLTTYLKNLLEDDRYKKSDGSKYNIYRDGLKIYTTINLNMQEHAEDAMRKHMKVVQNRYFDLWDNRNPWTDTKTIEASTEIRGESLDKLVRESDRFRELRNKNLGPNIQAILKKWPKSRMWDGDIMRMLKAEGDPNYLSKLLREDIIRKDQKAVYSEILKSDLWTDFKKTWNSLNDKAKVAFNKKTSMTVFDYETGKEKTASMTPLDSIKYHRMHMQLGSVSIDPESGFVKTWVGGVGNKYFQYDHVTSNRQVGSTFKPFVYATAIFQQSFSPCQRVQDIQYTIPANDTNFGLLESWSPSNSRGTFAGNYVTLKEGLKKSLNSVSVWLMKQLGSTSAVKDLAENMGIKRSKIPDAPSICLGSADLNVLEMTSAYTTFANDGVHNKPIFVTKIEDKNGKIIYTALPEKRRALPSNYNYVMVNMLKYAASFIQPNLETEIGGKTGTTNDYVDGWFIGISPNLVTGTWVGGEDQWVRFESIEQGQGGVMARPFFVDFMKRVENDNELNWDKNAKFTIPTENTIEVDCSKYEQVIRDNQQTEDTLGGSEQATKVKVLNPKEDEFEEEFDEEF